MSGTAFPNKSEKPKEGKPWYKANEGKPPACNDKTLQAREKGEARRPRWNWATQ